MKVEIPGKVSEVMTRDVVSVGENDTLTNLLGTLEVMRFRHLPVTEDNRLIGLVTQTDLLGVASSSLLPHHEARDLALQGRFHVRDIMTRDVLTVSPDTPLQEAGRVLLEQRVGCVCVVDEENLLVGIVTSSDFIQVVVRARPLPGARGPSGANLVQ